MLLNEVTAPPLSERLWNGSMASLDASIKSLAPIVLGLAIRALSQSLSNALYVKGLGISLGCLLRYPFKQILPLDRLAIPLYLIGITTLLELGVAYANPFAGVVLAFSSGVVIGICSEPLIHHAYQHTEKRESAIITGYLPD